MMTLTAPVCFGEANVKTLSKNSGKVIETHKADMTFKSGRCRSLETIVYPYLLEQI